MPADLANQRLGGPAVARLIAALKRPRDLMDAQWRPGLRGTTRSARSDRRTVAPDRPRRRSADTDRVVPRVPAPRGRRADR